MDEHMPQHAYRSHLMLVPCTIGLLGAGVSDRSWERAASYAAEHPMSSEHMSLPHEVQSSIIYATRRYEALLRTERSNNKSPGSYEVGVLEKQADQQRAECRITCGRGNKLAEMLGTGCSTPRLAL